MAKKLKPEDAIIRNSVHADDLKRVVRDINRHRENASENSGLAGQAAKQAIEHYGLDRAALNLVVRLSRAEPSKQQSTLLGINDYAEKLGMYDQIDAFDDTIGTLRRIVERAEAGGASAGSGGADPVMQDLVGGVH